MCVCVQVRPQENKSLFNLVFTEQKGELPKVEVNKTEGQCLCCVVCSMCFGLFVADVM